MASLMGSLQDNLSVLLVDDEEGFVQTLARRLGQRGLAVPRLWKSYARRRWCWCWCWR